ncbi:MULTISPECIES: 2-amino-4-deoxychorismate synthase SgcD [Streptomyces]|uniref:2-amino-4-deoxychorismate synthase SgcD n=1 Tax=Streptomyces TaxID=1883 RepID=UPI0004CA30A9|nr:MULTISPECIES: 2-amino-4-deoxychorismate synthase SgcD [Streptomyces]MDX2918408.1 anthranilate synthase component I family protein [Streptomyces sp. NE06-03C]MDX3606489.1 anthranilate synthase component I family protein [Streptomyces sp. FL06-04B]MDX3739528.1 anthranilate synthase component I family protein [Streptomyces sp. ID01-15D]
MTDQCTVSAPVRVRTRRLDVKETGSLPAYRALAEHFGPDEVYLLESAAGPARDRRHQFVGFGALLSLSVTDRAVRVEGVPALRGLLLERAGALLEDGPQGLRLRTAGGLWSLLRAMRDMFDAEGSASGFRFGFLGFFGYDTARYIEDLPHLIETRPDLPDVRMVLHRGSVVTDLANGRSELLLHESPYWPGLAAETVTGLLADAERSWPDPSVDGFPASAVTDDSAPEVFANDVERCLKHIAVGDIYQVQIGHELSIRSSADPADVYQRLRRRNASPYMYLAGIDGHRLIGASPELFVRIEDGEVTMRPIAGTVPRSGPDGGTAAGVRLRSDPKEIAEHTMLVDLCRNDIGRIARPNTLDVPDQLDVEGYSHVMHLVSTVVGRARVDTDAFDSIAALFPAGTMTGAPKIRAMEIIESVERSRRGLYAGALGLLDVGGYTNLALCIRTLFHHEGVYRTRASAGIVADSEPGAEWTETLAKMSATHWAVTGEELL